MRPRTPTFFWIPFVFSIGTISWALLIVGLILLSIVTVAPSVRDVKQAEAQRNDYQATLDLLDQKIALQKEFLAAAKKDPVLMERLASRQLNLSNPNEESLHLDPEAPYRDHSVESLLAESLTPTTPAIVKPAPTVLTMALNGAVRQIAIILGCVAMALSFFLGVRYERR
jgi:hypothetical protein